MFGWKTDNLILSHLFYWFWFFLLGNLFFLRGFILFFHPFLVLSKFFFLLPFLGFSLLSVQFILSFNLNRLLWSFLNLFYFFSHLWLLFRWLIFWFGYLNMSEFSVNDLILRFFCGFLDFICKLHRFVSFSYLRLLFLLLILFSLNLSFSFKPSLLFFSNSIILPLNSFLVFSFESLFLFKCRLFLGLNLC